MKVLGIYFGHNAAATLVVDGKVVAAIEEEKLIRKKGYIGMPYMAMEYVLKEGSIEIGEVDHIALAQEDLAEFVYDFWNLVNVTFKLEDEAWLKRARFWLKCKQWFPFWDNRKALEKWFYQLFELKFGVPKEKFQKVNHHLAHAASAAWTSTWEDALSITADGKGDGLCGSCYQLNQGKMEKIDELPDRFSVGQLYQAVTKFFSFKVNRHEGKVTGLAAYGDSSRVCEDLEKVVYWKDGKPQNKFWENEEFVKNPLSHYQNRVKDKWYMKENYIKSLNGNLRQYAILHQLYQNHLVDHHQEKTREDVAAGVQKFAENFLIEYTKRFTSKETPSRVALAGGTFANVKINQHIRELEGVSSIFVQSAMDDAGCALGAAFEVSNRFGVKPQQKGTFNPYLGPCYSEEEIRSAVAEAGLKCRETDNPDEVVASELANGTIVGRYYRRLEWGPRALGNRSILVRASDPAINKVLNDRLNRSDFMPFAPVVLGEEAENYLIGFNKDNDLASRYMTVTYHVVKEKVEEMAAAVHVDGTARPQVLYATENEEFHRFMQCYHRVSGVPIILNTSFNMHEEPIVNTPSDAIRAYLSGAVDLLHLQGLIVERK